MRGIVTSDKIQKVYNHYDVKVKVMGDTIEITRYSDVIRSLKKGYTSPFKKRECYSKKTNGEIRNDSLNRSFSRLMDLAITNHDIFSTFITLTFEDNMTDLTKANKMFNDWVSNVRKVYPDFAYLGVPEFQKRGAVHYHLMTNLKLDSDVITLQKDKVNMFDVKYWSHGFTSVFDLSLTDNNFSIALYLSKYFYKEIDNRLFNRKKILASRNLKEPTIEKMLKSEVEKIEKYIEGKKMVKQKSIVPANEYAPTWILISTFK